MRTRESVAMPILILGFVLACSDAGGAPSGSVTVSRVEVTASQTTMRADQVAQAQAKLTLSDSTVVVAPSTEVTWVSSAPAVATVSASGMISGVSVGTANIAAHAGSVSGSVDIQVTKAAGIADHLVIRTQPGNIQSGTSFSPAPQIEVRDVIGNLVSAPVDVTAAIASGTSAILTGSKATTSSGVATFTNLGATGSGSYVLTFLASGVPPVTSATFSIASGSARAATIDLSPLAVTRVAGGTVSLVPTVRDSTGTVLVNRPLSWLTSDVGVATVDATGVVTAVGVGSAQISASADGVTSSKASVSVVPVLSGSVALAGGTAVGGGVVEVLLGSTVIQSVPVTPGGTYSLDRLQPGTYALRFQPALAYSMGSAEPAQKSLTVAAAQSSTMTQSFTVQNALYADDFQSYNATSQIIGGCSTNPIPAGDFFAGTNRGMYGCANTGQISLDPLGGTAAGQRATRYDWPARLGQSGEYTLNLEPRILNPPQTPNLYVRWTSKESANFVNASDAATGASRSYKFLLIQLTDVVGGNPQFGVYLDDGPMTSLQIDASDRGFGHSNDHSLQRYNLPAGWAGQYHTYVAEVIGMGTDTCTFSLWMDGTKVITAATIPFLPGQVVGGSGQFFAVAMGANINSGPDRAQSRWWRELGIYTTRPSTRPMAP